MKILSKLPTLFYTFGVCYGIFNFLYSFCECHRRCSLTDAMNMMADYGFTRTLIALTVC